ncbi:MAG: hypothetical protein SGARI_004254 [Bacillariaceae sp.]
MADRHLFQNLQDVRLECTLSQTQCVIQGFQGCGYSVPQYNLYNDDTGVFIVDDVNKGDTSFELRGCNAVLGSAECDAGCTCHDLATGEPCDFAVLPPRESSSLPARQDNTTPKIIFEDLREATLTCHAVGARCDEVLYNLEAHTCGSSLSEDSVQAIATSITPAALRIDEVKKGTAVTFSSCSDDQTFAMECDARCVCMDAETGRPCHCTNSATADGACHDLSQDWLGGLMIRFQIEEERNPLLIVLIGVGFGVAIVACCLCLICGKCFATPKTTHSSKRDDIAGYKKVPGDTETICTLHESEQDDLQLSVP